MSAFRLSHASAERIRLMGSTIFSRSFLRVAVLSTAGLAASVPAKAAVFWLDDDDVMRPRAIMTPEPPPAAPQQRRHDRLKQQSARLEKQAKEHAKPAGPLVIAISINNQTMRVFDANGLFAETRVSTGMRGHETPMGVFSIIQKNKWHKSNIYSGAPMPYMQRITWSGIALHAGVLPGYPASHGCIRMPMAFATKLWGWTRMGARVIITPGEISPAEFSHPQLIAQKPAQTVSATVAPPQAGQSAATKPLDDKSPNLGLKPTTGSERSRTVTADAAGALAKPVLSDAPKAELPLPAVDLAKPADRTSDKETRVTRRDVDEAAAKAAELPAAAAKKDETPAADLPPKSPLLATTTDVKTEDARPAEAPRMDVKADTKPDVKTASQPDAAKRDAVDVPPPADTSPKRTGQIAVLISGKDGKLYVRQNFSPLFETPIVIKPSDRPLGTHVFTARIDKDEAKSIHWSAASLPAVARHAATEETGRRNRKPVAAGTSMPPQTDSATEALDRISIPEDAMTQIAEAIATGGSIIVSDQSLKAGGETGQGTEFVVPMR